ncbi:MAG: ATP-binding protein [Deltaproteobacteria bacterium]|nr:ATP-binding protein [Deltaproteobacteria bacterium]
MPDHDLQVISGEDALHLLELVESALNSKDLAALAQGALPIIVKLMAVDAGILYLEEPKPSTYSFSQVAMQGNTLLAIEHICLEQFHKMTIQAGPRPLILPLSPPQNSQVALFLLHRQENKMGILGLLVSENRKPSELKMAERFVFLLSRFIAQQVERLECEKKIAKLNAYFTVCSKIAKALNLRDVLEAVLYSSMKAVSAEAASVLLLDDKKQNFRFFGLVPPQPTMMDAKFPANRGLAGKILKLQQSEIINDVQNDPRFYRRFDKETGFKTRNMVAVPLLAGKEKVGVLEVLNKAGGEPFQEEDRLLLQSIAEEIAFAIHDAKLSEAKQALTAEIEKMHQFQAKLIQTSQDGIMAHDPHGEILIFNEGAERILGYRKEEVIGKINAALLFPPGVSHDIREKITGPEFGGTGRLINYETFTLSKTGEQIPVELSAIPIYEDEHEIATVGFFRDLRERRQLQEKLLQSERLAALGQMAAHITHEVKNPLMVVGGMARQVLKGLADDQQKNAAKLKIIIEEIGRLEDFLAEVGSFAKLSETSKGFINPNTVIQDLAVKLEPSLNERNIKLLLKLDTKLPQIQFAPLQLSQVLLNIAKNGIEAMPAGGSLTFVSGCRNDRVFVQINDTGEGIPFDIMAKIFQPFYSTKPKGSGLGLSISKTIIEAHQGEIKIESEAGKGTSVTIFLKARL